MIITMGIRKFQRMFPKSLYGSIQLSGDVVELTRRGIPVAYILSKDTWKEVRGDAEG